MRTLAALLLFPVLTLAARAAEPWLKAGDVVALVGGEDMVALAEEGWLETLITWAQPHDHIRWRSLAWEGDTVFEQRRDLNYPTLEAQLDKMGATVVLCQFGKMESFAGKEGVAAFTEAYEKLLARLNPEGKRRIALVLPSYFGPRITTYAADNGYGCELTEAYVKKLERLFAEKKRPISSLLTHTDWLGRWEGMTTLPLPDLTSLNPSLDAYQKEIRTLAEKNGALVLDSQGKPFDDLSETYNTRDGIHVVLWEGNFHWRLWSGLEPNPVNPDQRSSESLNRAIQAKNRAWFHYTRPQNWAFLAGNRTNQPSSRDHKDPTKRWFPEEMEQWLPLIAAKEQEIWKLAEAPR